MCGPTSIVKSHLQSIEAGSRVQGDQILPQTEKRNETKQSKRSSVSTAFQVWRFMVQLWYLCLLCVIAIACLYPAYEILLWANDSSESKSGVEAESVGVWIGAVTFALVVTNTLMIVACVLFYNMVSRTALVKRRYDMQSTPSLFFWMTMHLSTLTQSTQLVRVCAPGSRFLYRFYLNCMRARVGQDVCLWSTYLYDWIWLRINDRVNIERGVTVTPHEVLSSTSEHVVRFGKITIEDNVRIGMEVALHMDVSIGKGAVLDPLCRPMISESIPPGTRYTGVPGRIRPVMRTEPHSYTRHRLQSLYDLNHLSSVSVVVIDVDSPLDNDSATRTLPSQRLPHAVCESIHDARSRGLHVVLVAPSKSSSWGQTVVCEFSVDAVVCEAGGVTWVRHSNDTSEELQWSETYPMYAPCVWAEQDRLQLVSETREEAALVLRSLSFDHKLVAGARVGKDHGGRDVSVDVMVGHLSPSRWEVLEKRALSAGLCVSTSSPLCEERSEDGVDKEQEGRGRTLVTVHRPMFDTFSSTKRVLRSLFSLSDASMQRQCVFIGSVGADSEQHHHQCVSRESLFDFFPRSVGVKSQNLTNGHSDDGDNREGKGLPSYLCPQVGTSGWKSALGFIVSNSGVSRKLSSPLPSSSSFTDLSSSPTTVDELATPDVLPSHAQYDFCVVIPCFNAVEDVRRTLAALYAAYRHSAPDTTFEVILMDNNSSSQRLYPVYEQYFGKLPLQLVLREQLPHTFALGSARNHGISMARSDIIVLMDSDCMPQIDYFINLRSQLEALNTASSSSRASPKLSGRLSVNVPFVAAGERVFVDASNLKASELEGGDKALLDSLPLVGSVSNYGQVKDRRFPELLDVASHEHPWAFFHGGNMMFRKCDALRIGGFNTAYDGHWGYEETEFTYRIVTICGARPVYVPNVKVYHQERVEESCGTTKETEADRMDKANNPNWKRIQVKIPGFAEYKAEQYKKINPDIAL